MDPTFLTNSEITRHQTQRKKVYLNLVLINIKNYLRSPRAGAVSFSGVHFRLWLSFVVARAARMAATPARGRADYDHLIKLLLIGDSGKCFFLVSSPLDQNTD